MLKQAFEEFQRIDAERQIKLDVLMDLIFDSEDIELLKKLKQGTESLTVIIMINHHIRMLEAANGDV